MKNLLIISSVLLGSSLLVATTPSTPSVKEHLTTSYKRDQSNAAAGPVGIISIIVDKSDYSLSVYDDKGWYATYPVVFGNNSLEDKKMEGDKNTPEGTFHIVGKKVHDKWFRFMMLDYPNKESWEKFRKSKANGEIPASASIGGGVGIHGTWPHEDFVIDRYKNWTNGCVSMKNNDVQDLYTYTGVGTTVTIRP
jgi:murein L,D-transpeptidase YafK